MRTFKDYPSGKRFISEGQIVKAVDNYTHKLGCSDCLFSGENSISKRCFDHACSHRIFKLSRLNKLIFWKKKINKK